MNENVHRVNWHGVSRDQGRVALSQRGAKGKEDMSKARGREWEGRWEMASRWKSWETGKTRVGSWSCSGCCPSSSRGHIPH